MERDQVGRHGSQGAAANEANDLDVAEPLVLPPEETSNQPAGQKKEQVDAVFSVLREGGQPRQSYRPTPGHVIDDHHEDGRGAQEIEIAIARSHGHLAFNGETLPLTSAKMVRRFSDRRSDEFGAGRARHKMIDFGKPVCSMAKGLQ